MKIRTSDLTGKALTYVVCMLEMPHLVWGQTIGLHAHSDQLIVPELGEPAMYSPYTGWGQCGPIIEREDIELTHAEQFEVRGIWRASADQKGLPKGMKGYYQMLGPKQLIAAMRCLISSKLGNEVEIPEELT